MTEEEMILHLRSLGYKVRQKATGHYLVRYSAKRPFGCDRVFRKYAVRLTRFRGEAYDRGVPKDAEIAEIDLSKLKWERFWPEEKPKETPNAQG